MEWVLVVEDDRISREALKELLELEGYDVREAANGQEALDVLKGSPTPPCTILLDIMMPIMDGLEFRDRQLKDPAIASVPVVVMSGKANLGNIQNLSDVTIISKPLNLKILVAAVAQHGPRRQ